MDYMIPFYAFKTVEDAIIILDPEWRFLCSNESANRLFPSLLTISEKEPVKNHQAWPVELGEVDKLTETIFEYEKGGANGQKFTFRIGSNKIIDDCGAHVAWSIVLHDITSMAFLINQLKNLAATDSLTGAATRRSFLERVDRELEMSKPYRLNQSNALLMYDIDDFKKVNDTYGHPAGDHVLCEAVDIVKKQLRSYDIIARYGGEEFVVFMPASKEEYLYEIADRCRNAIERTEITYNGERIFVTASFGAVQLPPGANFEDAMIAVDDAMYQAKHSGKNMVVVGTIKKGPETASQEDAN